MALSFDDHTAVTDLISLHGHLFDAGELDRLDELFTPDVVYDVTDFGGPPLEGIAAIRAAALALGDGNPLGHHVTNLVLTQIDADVVHARCKGIGVASDGTASTVTYEDTVLRTPHGWRISHRKIRAHRHPLGGARA